MFNPFAPLQHIKPEVFTSLPAKFRNRTRTEWAHHNRQGAEIECFIVTTCCRRFAFDQCWRVMPIAIDHHRHSKNTGQCAIGTGSQFRVGGNTSVPNVLVSGMAFLANTLKELIEYTKAQLGKLNYSNPIGAFSHVDMLDLCARTGMQSVNVPSKGAGSTVAAVISGEIHFTFLAAAAVVPYVKGARMKAYVVTSRQRLPEVPEVPTMAETGYPGIGSEH